MSTRKPTYTLNEKQRTELKVQMEKFQHDGHYGAAYKYLMDNIPRSEYRGNAPVHSSDEAGLSTWLSVAISTNTRSGDIVDTTLRSMTKEIMKERGINDGYSDDKYNRFSNELASKILSEIARTGRVSREEIIQADAENFTKFGGESGKIKIGDWPGAIIDSLLLGGNVINASDDINWKALLKGVNDGVGDWSNDRWGELGKWLLPKLYEQSEDLEKFFEWLNPFKNFNKDGKYYVTDPLVLDLDGDGIETVSHNGYKGALFDHDGDGIRTASGWVGKDDGLLVIDRNGDGVINDGSELFGDSYILKDGTKAAHGYAALAEYDENGDGVVDADDAGFAKLRVWRDLNQDGISQQDELFTLEEAGVQSLNAAYQDTNQNLGNGNRLAQEGSYTDKDGKERKMGDLLFGNNTLYSRYSESVKLTDEQRAAANLQGMGRLRDLREAAALSPLLQSYYRIEFKQKQKCLWKTMQGQFKRSSETVFQTTF